MAYTRVQCIGYVLDTAPQPNPDGSGTYLGLGDPELDIDARCQLMARALQAARTALPQASPPQPPGEVLTVFMAPEFFFRGASGAYRMDDVQRIIATLQRMVAGDEWLDWIFVFGTILGASVATLPTPPYDADPLAATEIYNFALVQQGGVAAQGDSGARVVMKELMSGVDFVAAAPAPHSLLLGDVAYWPASTGSGFGREQQQVNYDGAGVFELAGITWALEVCLDHLGTVQRLQRSPQLPGQKLVQMQLVPSCGMGIEAPSVITQPGGLVFNCDGSGATRHSTLARQGPPLADVPLAASIPVDGSDIVLPGSSPVQDVAVGALFAGGAGVVNVYPAQSLPAQQLVPGHTVRLDWPASWDYRFIFQLVYGSNGQFVTLVCEIRSNKTNFYGNNYFLPLSLQTQDSWKQDVRIQMKVVPASSPYAGAVWCSIHVPGFTFEGCAFEFAAAYDGPAPYTIWSTNDGGADANL